MLSNAYFLAKFGFDTAENEPAKNVQQKIQNLPILPILINFANFADLPGQRLEAGGLLGQPQVLHRGGRLRVHRHEDEDLRPRAGRPTFLLTPSWQNLQFLIIFANFCRARSRLYQNEILQENMRLTAFFKLYKVCILLHRCNLKIFAKNRFEKSAIFVKIQQN